MLLQTGSAMPALWPAAVLDILLVAFLIYQFLMLVRGRRAAQVLVGVLVLFALYAVSRLFELVLMGKILDLILPYTPLAPLLGFRPLPVVALLAIFAIVAAYFTSAEMAKRWFFKRYPG